MYFLRFHSLISGIKADLSAGRIFEIWTPSIWNSDKVVGLCSGMVPTLVRALVKNLCLTLP